MVGNEKKRHCLSVWPQVMQDLCQKYWMAWCHKKPKAWLTFPVQNHHSWVRGRCIYKKRLQKFSCTSKSNQNLVEILVIPISFAFYQITIFKLACTDQSVLKIAALGNFILTTSQLKAFGSVISCTGLSSISSRNVWLLLLLVLLLRVTWILGPDLQYVYFIWCAWAHKLWSLKQ